LASRQHTTQLDFFLDETAQREAAARRRAESAEKIRVSRLGKKWSEAAKRKMSESHKGLLIGEKNPLWKGGEIEIICKVCGKSRMVKRYVAERAQWCSRACRRADPNKKSALHKRIRASVEYRAWRLAVFTRDDYTCQMCHTRGGTLQADHIKPFSLFPELRFEVDNGRTLCLDCHTKTETYGVYTSRRKAFLASKDAANEIQEGYTNNG
jgi:5-methylcytosine-specific restriction endonuclease McrA